MDDLVDNDRYFAEEFLRNLSTEELQQTVLDYQTHSEDKPKLKLLRRELARRARNPLTSDV